MKRAAKFHEIKLLNAKLNALTAVADSATISANAAESDARWARGSAKSPIDGWTVAIKDNICTRKMPTTCASAFLKGAASPFDATVIRLLEAAGCNIVAKTNMDEFGMGSANVHSAFGPVRNPRSMNHVAGGSSGGSAAAVSSGMVDAALGSDTGGSVRLPAAYCGVVGFKPSYGRLSRWGLVSYASSLDTVGILARSVQDVKQLFDVLAKQDERDPSSFGFRTEILDDRLRKGDLSGVRVGIPKEYRVEGLSAAALSAWDMAIRRLEKRGAKIIPVSLPHTKWALPAYYILAPAEASSNLSRFDGVRFGNNFAGGEDQDVEPSLLYSDARTRGFGEEVQRRIILGTFVTSSSAYQSYYMQAQKIRRLIKSEFETFLSSPALHETDSSTASSTAPNGPNGAPEANASSSDGICDVLLTPAAMGPAPTFAQSADPERGPLEEYINDVMTIPASLAGIPAIVVPVSGAAEAVTAEASDGTCSDVQELPVGIQLLSRHGRDDYLLTISQYINKGT